MIMRSCSKQNPFLFGKKIAQLCFPDLRMNALIALHKFERGHSSSNFSELRLDLYQIYVLIVLDHVCIKRILIRP